MDQETPFSSDSYSAGNPTGSAVSTVRPRTKPRINKRSSSSGKPLASNRAKKRASSSPVRAPEDGNSRWEGMMQGLIDYKTKNNSFNVPHDYRWNGKNLYEWCRNNRKHYLNGIRGKTPALRPQRKQRLQEIGFELDPTGAHGQNDAIDDKRWVAMFDGLVVFRQQYGSFAVPIGYMCESHSLHDWVRHQRKQYSTTLDLDGQQHPALSAARIDRLFSIGFDLDPADPTRRRQDHRTDQERWTIMFEGLQDYHNRHGDVVVASDFVHDGRNLSSWYHNQRCLYANYLRNQQPSLSLERVEKLRSIGFVLDLDLVTNTVEGRKRPRSAAISNPQHASEILRKMTQQPRRKLIWESSANTGRGTSLPYTFNVTTEAERRAVSNLALSAASEVLSIYQDMTAQERSDCLNQEK